MNPTNRSHLIAVVVFGIAFAFVESSVVVYLRALYYPGGFSFPLKPMPAAHAIVELCREVATIVMLVAVGWMAGKSRWSRFGYFMIAFAVWDIFYYVWLKVLLNWPASLFDWDILFLIPIPWIGPVIAPCLVSLLMIATGVIMILKEENAQFHPPLSAWITAGIGTVAMLYSFILDTNATLNLQPPQPYRYEFLIAGLVLCTWGLIRSTKGGLNKSRNEKGG
jgi:hypothetical protein